MSVLSRSTITSGTEIHSNCTIYHHSMRNDRVMLNLPAQDRSKQLSVAVPEDDTMGVVASASTTIAVAIASASDCVVTILLAAETRKDDTGLENTLRNPQTGFTFG